MRDYFGEFLKNPTLGSGAGLGSPPPQQMGATGSGGLPTKYKILWVLSLAGTGFGVWKVSKFHAKIKGALKGAKTASRKRKGRKRLAKD